MNDSPPIVWSVSGTDSGGGAGLAADQRAVEAFGAHLCPVVAAVTAQNSLAVSAVQPVPPEGLDAQLAALAADLPPRAIKCGLLGSAANARVLARWVDRLRAEHGPIALVIDPVLGATTGARFADAELLAVYRAELLPRASAISPNRREAAELAGQADCAEPGLDTATALAALAELMRAAGARAVCITGGDAAGPWALDTLATPQAAGTLALPRVPTPHHHGTGCTFASAWAAALALGFVEADGAILAKMATTHALRRASPLGRGAGPVRAAPGFGLAPSLLPRLARAGLHPAGMAGDPPHVRPAPGVYAIVDSAARVAAALAGGADTVQLRVKTPPSADAAWRAGLQAEIAAAVQAARAAGRPLYINDHWREAMAAGAHGVHLGQEDLLALGDDERRLLAAARARGLALGLSSHSLWELARAAHEAPDYIACGPVWPTTTKAMPWHPQGLHNLAWWAAVAPAPVVAIGGILEPAQLTQAAAHGAMGGCVVRGLGDAPERRLPAWRAAWQAGLDARRGTPGQPPELPRPTL
jgi:hydroxymethylpyrimidine kinase/phosphomethylpyrimidine kinase/thiamine-phosphate diphosphorylase